MSTRRPWVVANDRPSYTTASGRLNPIARIALNACAPFVDNRPRKRVMDRLDGRPMRNDLGYVLAMVAVLAVIAASLVVQLLTLKDED
jgi:hypothetical protein